MNFPMARVAFTMSHPVNQPDVIRELTRKDVADLIADAMYLPEGKLTMQHPEDFNGDASIVFVLDTPIPGRVAVEAKMSQWMVDSFCTRKELSSFYVYKDNRGSIEKIKYVWRGIKWIDERIASN